MTVSVAGPKPLKCSEFTPEELKQDTPHATLGEGDASKVWVGFGIAEAGQLNKANRDREIERQICAAVEKANDEARAQAEKRVKKWWQVF